MAPLLAYWDIRGLAAPIRFVLEYAGVNYTEKLYKCGPPPNFDRQEWLNDKPNLGLDFPNLPYYIDGDLKLTQSGVIVRYLARKHGLDAKNEQDRLRVELAESQVRDYMNDSAKLCYSPDFNKLKDDYIKGLGPKLELMSKFLGDRKFIAGDYVTYADFWFFEYLIFKLHMVPELLKDFANLKAYYERIENLEPIKKYMESERYIKEPYNGPIALFGGRYSDILNK